MDTNLGYKIDYIKQKYQTIHGVPVENLPSQQIGAIYIRMCNAANNPRQRKVKTPNIFVSEYQLTIDDILKGELNG